MFFLGLVLILMHMFYVVSPECPLGFYASLHRCQRCLPECRSGQVVIDTCNQTNQFICECPPNKYWNGNLALCQMCTPCDFDEIVTQNCTHLKNRECSKCPLGTFVKTPYYCEKCLHCEQGETVIRKCSGSENTLCSRKPHINTTDKPAFTQSQPEPSHDPEKAENNESDTTVVILSILVAFFVVALVMVCLCWRLTSQRKHKYPESSFTDDSEIDDFVKKRPFPPVRETGLKLRDLNLEAMETLCSLLNPDGLRNWKMLAGKLGYSQNRIQNLQLHVGESCQKLFEEWSTERNATVCVLYHHLLAMQRDDCCELLLKYLVEDVNKV